MPLLGWGCGEGCCDSPSGALSKNQASPWEKHPLKKRAALSGNSFTTQKQLAETSKLLTNHLIQLIPTSVGPKATRGEESRIIMSLCKGLFPVQERPLPPSLSSFGGIAHTGFIWRFPPLSLISNP